MYSTVLIYRIKFDVAAKMKNVRFIFVKQLNSQILKMIITFQIFIIDCIYCKNRITRRQSEMKRN